MSKTITLILVALFSVACGGEPFAATEFGAIGGEAAAGDSGTTDAAGSPAVGSAGASSGGSSVGHGGAASAGSSAAGKPTGGASQGGTGGAPVTCELDVEKLTAALPDALVWEDYTYTDGQNCTTCRDSPCATIKVISWGVPQVMEDGRLQYQPNVDMKMVSMNFGANDGSCTKQVECGITPGVSQLLLTVTKNKTGWVVATSEMLSGFGGNQCVSRAGTVGPAAADLDSETNVALQGLEIPCD